MEKEKIEKEIKGTLGKVKIYYPEVPWEGKDYDCIVAYKWAHNRKGKEEIFVVVDKGGKLQYNLVFQYPYRPVPIFAKYGTSIHIEEVLLGKSLLTIKVFSNSDWETEAAWKAEIIIALPEIEVLSSCHYFDHDADPPH